MSDLITLRRRGYHWPGRFWRREQAKRLLDGCGSSSSSWMAGLPPICLWNCKRTAFLPIARVSIPARHLFPGLDFTRSRADKGAAIWPGLTSMALL